MSAAAQAPTESIDEEGMLNVSIDNESDPECTVLTVEGKDQPHLLMTLSGALTTAGFLVRGCGYVGKRLWPLAVSPGVGT